MPTGDTETNIYNKVLMTEEKLGTHFLTFLHNLISDTTEATFLSPGVLDDDAIGLGSTANDTFTLDISSADRVLAGDGHIVDLSGVASSLYTSYPFENATGDTYYVGIRYQQVPSGIERNPRSGDPEYPYLEESWGEKGTPDSVTDNTTYIRVVINGILESGIDHSGRPVRVWLVNPVSVVETVAYYDGTVSYSNPNNYVDIPYTGTLGPLGQTAPTFPISTTAADYQVHVQGVSWFEGTDLSADDNYAFIGTVLGNGPAAIPVTFDITDQKQVFWISLDRAYRANSTATPAPGRTIDADKWAVRITQGASSQREMDPANMAFRVEKFSESITGGGGIGVMSPWNDYGALPLSMFQNAADAASGGDLEPLEDVDLVNPATISFNRGGVGLTTIEDIIGPIAAVWVTGTTSEAQDGLYLVDTIATASTITVTNLDRTSPAFSGESNVKLRFLLVTSLLTHKNPFETTYSADEFTHFLPFSQAYDGIQVRMRGTPKGDNQWLAFSASEGDYGNVFCTIKAGRVVMRTGGETRLGQTLVGGQAQFTVDKIDVSDLASTWLPADAQDWGFDYRGSSYTKETSTDDPAFALAGTFRSPSWFYASGAQEWDPSEAFTRFDAEQLTLTGVGGLEKLMGDSGTAVQSSCGGGWILVEVRYATPDPTDGIYLIKDVDTVNDRVSLMQLDGGAPGFPPGSGTARIFAGSFAGPIYGEMENVKAWTHQIVAPTANTGCLRLGNPWGRMQLLCASMPTGQPGSTDFYIRGGKTYATALTTRQKTVASLPAAGAIEASDVYPGNLHLTSTGPDDILLPATLGANTDRIKREGGSTWQYWRAVDVLKGHPMDNSGTLSWYLPSAANGDYWLDQAGAIQAFLAIPLYIPHGATLNQIECSLTAQTSDGTGNSMGIDIRRMTWNGASSVSLASGGVVRTNGSAGSQATFSFSCDQNNVIDRTQYTYWAWIEGSTSIGDRIWGARAQMTVTALGQSLFDAV